MGILDKIRSKKHVVRAVIYARKSPESIILESVLEAMAEYYSKNLSREVRKGMNENTIKGLHTGVVEDQEEIRSIVEKYLDKEGCGGNTLMNKFGYFFDWQENRGYEEIEVLNWKSCNNGIGCTSRETAKKINYKKFKSKNTNKNTVNKVFGLRMVRVGTNK